ncbi:hypothetical protein [Cereibacter ovatus]|uniref:hypothetical protein n=1 Tax=Cereibacter ovatus TaxID=439529 RepID=UPI001596F55D|nr:hypothetical protein [Cereibacter ovatus]
MQIDAGADENVIGAEQLAAMPGQRGRGGLCRAHQVEADSLAGAATSTGSPDRQQTEERLSNRAGRVNLSAVVRHCFAMHSPGAGRAWQCRGKRQIAKGGGVVSGLSGWWRLPDRPRLEPARERRQNGKLMKFVG